jgi:hypothetical protein
LLFSRIEPTRTVYSFTKLFLVSSASAFHAGVLRRAVSSLWSLPLAAPRIFQAQRKQPFGSSQVSIGTVLIQAKAIWFTLQFGMYKLRPNPSVNRTLCGGPSLGYISFSPKPGPPQSAGYLER